MNNVTSPDNSDRALEQEIQRKGLSAPRVTLASLENNIKSVDYVVHNSAGGQILRWAVITTRSGYAVVGRPSVAVSPANDNEEIAKRVAFENSRQALWPLMGYELKERLFEQSTQTQGE